MIQVFHLDGLQVHISYFNFLLVWFIFSPLWVTGETVLNHTRMCTQPFMSLDYNTVFPLVACMPSSWKARLRTHVFARSYQSIHDLENAVRAFCQSFQTSKTFQDLLENRKEPLLSSPVASTYRVWEDDFTLCLYLLRYFIQFDPSIWEREELSMVHFPSKTKSQTDPSAPACEPTETKSKVVVYHYPFLLLLISLNHPEVFRMLVRGLEALDDPIRVETIFRECKDQFVHSFVRQTPFLKKPLDADTMLIWEQLAWDKSKPQPFLQTNKTRGKDRKKGKEKDLDHHKGAPASVRQTVCVQWSLHNAMWQWVQFFETECKKETYEPIRVLIQNWRKTHVNQLFK